MIEIRLEGDWRKTRRFLNVLPFTLKSAAAKGERAAAEKLVRIVRGHIKRQDLGWQPNADDKDGDMILVDSGLYLSSIKSWKASNGYMAGVPNSVYNTQGVRVADYAVYNEFGFGKGPARPLWGPSVEEMGGSKGIRDIITRSIALQVSKALAAS
jgi:hypothetical protein